MSTDNLVMDLMVRTMRVAADGVLEIELIDPEGGRLPAWAPGAHIDLGLPHHVRQYSLCGDPGDRRRYVVAVLREQDSRGGSEYVHRTLRPGEIVEIGGPRNHFDLRPAAEYLFIAGGIGITPLLPMIDEAERSAIPWTLHYGGRTRATMAFVDRLPGPADKVHLYAEDTDGLIDLAAILGTPREGVAVYCCGPAGLIGAVEAACAAWPADCLTVERFTPKDLSGLDSRPIGLRCARSGLRLTVPSGESILDVLEAAGLSVANACRDGVCGSCEVRVLAGVPDHRDSFRTAATPADTLAACVSRAVTDELVLDI